MPLTSADGGLAARELIQRGSPGKNERPWHFNVAASQSINSPGKVYAKAPARRPASAGASRRTSKAYERSASAGTRRTKGSPRKVHARPASASASRRSWNVTNVTDLERDAVVKQMSATSLRRPSTAGSVGGDTLRRDPRRATLSQQEATKQFPLRLELSQAQCNFGVLKQGFRYTFMSTLTNRSAAGLRWRIARAALDESFAASSRDSGSPFNAPGVGGLVADLVRGTSGRAPTTGDDQIACATPRGRLAPGVGLRLAFEVVARRPGPVEAAFLIQGEEDAVRTDPDRLCQTLRAKNEQRTCAIRVRCAATVFKSDDFKAHVLQQRFERKPLLAKGVACAGRLPASQVVEEPTAEPPAADDASDAPSDASRAPDAAANDWLAGSALPQRAIDLLEGQEAGVVDELAHVPFFPGCVYDPGTGELRIDEAQQGFVVDPTRTLEECVAEYDARNATRMAALEGGGLLTGRCLAEFARRHLPEAARAEVDCEGRTTADAVRRVMEKGGLDAEPVEGH